MLTMVMAEGGGVGGGGHLRVVEVCDCQIAHGERMRGVCDDKFGIVNSLWSFC
jgi:hypothetical protein